MDYEPTPSKHYTSNFKRVGRKHRIAVKTQIDKARDDYNEAKRMHKAEIKTLKRAIRSHKLMIKQAKTTLRIVKLTNK
jgi:hypothetical protein